MICKYFCKEKLDAGHSWGYRIKKLDLKVKNDTILAVLVGGNNKVIWYYQLS